DVALSVSTVRARRGAAAPEVTPQRVAFAEPPVPAPMTRAKSAQVQEFGAVGGAHPQAADAIAPAPPLAPAREATAELDATAYAATFKTAGPVGVPGDGSAKTFPLSSR